MKKLLGNALLCAYRMALYLPVPMILGHLLLEGDQLTPALFYMLGQLAAVALSYVPSGKRVPVMLLGAAALIAGGIFWFNVPAQPLALIIIGLCMAGYFITARFAGKPGGERYDTREMIAGVVIHCIIPVIVQLSETVMDNTAFTWAGVAFFIMCPFVLNDSSVRSGMSLRGRGGKPIKRISSANRALVGGVVVIALLIANIEKLRQAVQSAYDFVAYWVLQFILWLTNLFPGSSSLSGENAAESSDMGLPTDVSEPNWFAELMQQILQYVVYAALVVAAIFVLYRLTKRLIKLAKRISEWAKKFASGVKEDYLEEREQLMDWGDVRSEMMDAVRERIKKLTTREKKWSELDARERVRYVMRGLYRKNGLGVSGIEYMSARQALDEMGLDDKARAEIGGLYDEARYSDHSITEAQAEKLRQDIK